MEMHAQRNRANARLGATAVMAFALLIVAAPSGAGRGAAASPPSAAPAATPTPAHQVLFKNNCSKPVWIADLGNFDVVPQTWELAPVCDPGKPRTCPAGSSCDGHACKCKTPGPNAPECHGGLCDSTGRCVTSEMVSVPQTFSGRFWPRTGCTGSGSSFKCVTGDCGGLDCFSTGRTANNATLWEMTLTGFSNLNGAPDDYDVSLVSGYNIPVEVQAEIPSDTPGWKPKSAYFNGQGGHQQSVIVAPSGPHMWRLNNIGPQPSATSGATMPRFAQTLRSSVNDPAGGSNTGILWSTTVSTCQTAECATDLLASCPPVLRVDDSSASCTSAADCGGAPCDSNGTCVVACSTANTFCAGSDPDPTVCTARNQAFFLCLNTLSSEEDPFGNKINLESGNAATPLCFTADDCPPGTKCLFKPSFTPASKVSFPAGAGLCVPGNGLIPQNGGCISSAQDGQACPAPNFTFPFPRYSCATLTNDGSGNSVLLCVPPVTARASDAAAFGDLVWNADNFTPTATACTADAHCGAGQYCLEKNVHKAFFPGGGPLAAQSVDECAPPDTLADCVCNDVKHCSNDSGCTAGTKCLNSTGSPCAAGQKCLCQLDATYTGTCGPTNANWTDAIDSISSGGRNFLETFKAACPSAYSYQFDDVASNWSCTSTANELVGYTVTFCGTGGKGM